MKTMSHPPITDRTGPYEEGPLEPSPVTVPSGLGTYTQVRTYTHEGSVKKKHTGAALQAVSLKLKESAHRRKDENGTVTTRTKRAAVTC